MSADEAIAQVKTKLEPLMAPVNGGVGDDLSYDEALEALRAEIDKVNQIDGGKIDWSSVESQAATMLSSRTKDFRVVLYWGVARSQIAGLQGFFEGLVLLNEMNQVFWEPMYPALRRPRARGSLLAWFNELITNIVQHASPTAQQRDMVDAMKTLFREVDNFLAEKLGEAYPGMMTLSEGIRGLVMRVPAAPPPPVEAPPQSMRSPGSIRAPAPAPDSLAQTPADGAPVASFSAGAITDADSAYQALAGVAGVLGQASGVIFNADPVSADAYRLFCQSTWLLVAGDPYNEGGKTTIVGPGPNERQGLKDLAGAADWVGLANTAYGYVAQYPFWLDAVRALSMALEQQGEASAIARAVVDKEVAALVARAPNLPSLQFSDAMPFAEPDTQEWLKAAGSGGGGGGGGSKSPVDRAVAEATKLAMEGNLPQAMSVLNKAGAQASPAQRFVARLEIAKLALQNQLLDMARAQLEALERTAEEHRLAAWDPVLCAELYANLYKARRAASQVTMDDPDLGKRTAQSFERLCELDAARAFQVMNEA
ncbi:MAG: type VI secretion system protein TssA [Polyangiaceae bacterium]|nr:type VI secretion system protein TssA [Polyangiaceae bacterium]